MHIAINTGSSMDIIPHPHYNNSEHEAGKEQLWDTSTWQQPRLRELHAIIQSPLPLSPVKMHYLVIYQRALITRSSAWAHVYAVAYNHL